MADNLTLDIKKLQARITDMKYASLKLLPGTDTLQGIAEGLNSLNPLEWIKGVGGGLIGTLAIFCCFTIIFCLVLRCTRKSPLRTKEERSREIDTLSATKTKRGKCRG